MKVSVMFEGEKSFCISLPTWLAVNRITAGAAFAVLREKMKPLEIDLDWEDISRFLEVFRQVKHGYGGWCLVDVESSDGDRVQIWL